jgi:hypothetical protein
MAMVKPPMTIGRGGRVKGSKKVCGFFRLENGVFPRVFGPNPGRPPKLGERRSF